MTRSWAILVLAQPSVLAVTLAAQTMMEWERSVGLNDMDAIVPVALELDSASNAYVAARSRGILGEPQVTVLAKFDSAGSLVWTHQDRTAFLRDRLTPALVVDEARERIHFVGAGHPKLDLQSSFAVWTLDLKGNLISRTPLQDFVAGASDGFLYWHADTEGHIFAVGMDALLTAFDSRTADYLIRILDQEGNTIREFAHDDTPNKPTGRVNAPTAITAGPAGFIGR